MTPEEIVRFLRGRRLPLHNEKVLQQAIADEFQRAGIPARREVKLVDHREPATPGVPASIIDFLIGTVGIEVKIKGSRGAIYRQCERYCGFADLSDLVLLTNVAMGMPKQINGKSIWVVSLGRGWL